MPKSPRLERIAVRVVLASSVLLAAACTTPGPPPTPVARQISTASHSGNFTYCEGWGCAKRHRMGFTDAEWTQVRALFAEPAAGGAEERNRIVRAISLMEQWAGKRAGTSGDVGGTLTKMRSSGQLDCFSEAINTTNFLYLLHNDGLLRHHTIRPPAMRHWIYLHPVMGTHVTAVVRETASGEDYAIDSWFFDNGGKIISVRLRAWLRGYVPKGGARF